MRERNQKIGCLCEMGQEMTGEDYEDTFLGVMVMVWLTRYMHFKNSWNGTLKIWAFHFI